MGCRNYSGGVLRGASGERGRRHLHGTDTPTGLLLKSGMSAWLDGIRTHWILKNELKILFFGWIPIFAPV